MLPTQITLRGIESKLLENDLRKKSEKLQQYYKRVTSCRVVVDIEQNHKHQGKIYNVRIDVTVPGKELVSTHKMNEDVYLAGHEAFDAIYRQLEEHKRQRT